MNLTIEQLIQALYESMQEKEILVQSYGPYESFTADTLLYVCPKLLTGKLYELLKEQQ